MINICLMLIIFIATIYVTESQYQINPNFAACNLNLNLEMISIWPNNSLTMATTNYTFTQTFSNKFENISSHGIGLNGFESKQPMITFDIETIVLSSVQV